MKNPSIYVKLANKGLHNEGDDCFLPCVSMMRSAKRPAIDESTLMFFIHLPPPSESSATWSKTIWSSTSSIRGRSGALFTRVGDLF